MHQIALPIAVSPQEIARKLTLGSSIDLCMELACKEPKQISEDLKFDKAQISRWQSGQEGVNWPKLAALMDYCGNDAPLLWMLSERGYDLSSLRKQESELEKELRQTRERLLEIEREREVERRMWRDLRAAA